MDIRTQVISGLRWVVGTRLMTQGFTWVVTIVVIRILSPADYGLLAIATMFTGFLNMLSEAGLGIAIVQAPTLDDVALRKIFGFVLLINLVLCSALIAGAPLIARWFNEERLIFVVQALAISFLLVGFTAIPEALLDRRLEYRKRSLVDLSSAIFSSVLTLGMALGGFGVWALVAGSIGSAAVRMVGLQFLAPFVKRPIFSFAGLDGMLGFGGNVVLTRILWSFFSQMDVFIAGKLLGKELLGAYSVGMDLASLPAQKLGAIIYRVSFPAYSRLKEDASRLGKAFIEGVGVASFVGFPLSWGISSVAPEITHVILGPKWDAATIPITLLGLFMPLRIISPVVYSATEALGRPDLGVRNMLIASVVMPIALFVGCQWGLTGLSLAWVLVYPLVFIQNMAINIRVARVCARDFYGAMARPLFGAACMYGAVASTRASITLPPILEFAILILVGATTYSALTLLINRRGLDDVLNVVLHRR